MFCTNCGRKNPEHASFCFACGTPLAVATMVEAPASADASQTRPAPALPEGRKISAKRCPSCGLPNREAAEHCGCGYRFVGDAADSNVQLKFTGNGRDILSGEGLKTLLQYVSIVGIPWGWVSTGRWIARNIAISNGTKASFTGTVSQAWGFVALFLFVSILRRWNFSDADVFTGAPLLLAAAAIIWMCVLWALTAYIQLAFLRWEIERTALSSGSKPSFRGDFWANFGWQALTVVSIFTVIGWAWVSAAYFRWVCRNTTASDYQGRFVGTGPQILWRGVVAFLGCIPIVTIPAVLCWWNRWFFFQIQGVPHSSGLAVPAPSQL
jgi:hypothetical protein